MDMARSAAAVGRKVQDAAKQKKINFIGNNPNAAAKLGMKAGKKSRKARKSRKSRKSRRGGSRKSRGAGMVHRAALPFGLLALQKMMHRRKSRKSLKKFGKRVLKAPYRTAKFLL